MRGQNKEICNYLGKPFVSGAYPPFQNDPFPFRKITDFQSSKLANKAEGKEEFPGPEAPQQGPKNFQGKARESPLKDRSWTARAEFSNRKTTMVENPKSNAGLLFFMDDRFAFVFGSSEYKWLSLWPTIDMLTLVGVLKLPTQFAPLII